MSCFCHHVAATSQPLNWSSCRCHHSWTEVQAEQDDVQQLCSTSCTQDEEALALVLVCFHMMQTSKADSSWAPLALSHQRFGQPETRSLSLSWQARPLPTALRQAGAHLAKDPRNSMMPTTKPKPANHPTHNLAAAGCRAQQWQLLVLQDSTAADHQRSCPAQRLNHQKLSSSLKLMLLCGMAFFEFGMVLLSSWQTKANRAAHLSSMTSSGDHACNEVTLLNIFRNKCDFQLESELRLPHAATQTIQTLCRCCNYYRALR